jgi:hypothetical protein
VPRPLVRVLSALNYPHETQRGFFLNSPHHSSGSVIGPFLLLVLLLWVNDLRRMAAALARQ